MIMRSMFIDETWGFARNDKHLWTLPIQPCEVECQVGWNEARRRLRRLDRPGPLRRANRDNAHRMVNVL